MKDNVYLCMHPLISHKMTYIRDKKTGGKKFRELVEEVTMLMIYEVTRDMPVEEVEVDTPVARAKSWIISGKKPSLIPILRAGLGMVGGALRMIPDAKVGHIGVYRDPQTKKPVDYYSKLPADIGEREVILLDPMLATGGSAVSAVSYLKNKGVKGIKFVCLVASPEGVKLMSDSHPGVKLYAAALDEGLDENAYIIPGLGDAGDRLFGTK